MKHVPPFSLRSQPPRGAALVITLFFIVIISVIAVGFMDSARVERTAASSHFERMRAGTFAREGIENTVATLRRETVDPQRGTSEPLSVYQSRTRNWVSQPGMLIVADTTHDKKQLRKQVLISSGAPSPAFLASHGNHPELSPPNLNIQTLVDQSPPAYLISDRRDATGTAAKMSTRWVYVRKDGSYDLPDPTQAIRLPDPAISNDPGNMPIEEPDLTNKDNPIVGRFAYWTDDESSKINYNLAWKRNESGATPNLSQEAHPSRINLMALTLPNGSQLTEPLIDLLHRWTTKTPGRYFNSFADARQVSPEVASMLDYNRFELTHYNHDPDITFFGEDRILLTTNRKLVPTVKNADGSVAKNPDGTVKYARKFLDIMRDKNADGSDVDPDKLDPGILEDIAGGQPDWRANKDGKILLPNKLDAVVTSLITYVSKNKWPLFDSTTSFKDKYYPGTADSEVRLAQIVVNIIDYVRAKESPQPVIAPLRFIRGGASEADPSVSGKYTIHPSYTYGKAGSYQGISRAPLISEMGVWQAKDPVWPPAPPTDPPPPGWPTSPSAPASSIPGWPAELDTAGKPTGRGKRLYAVTWKSEVYLPANFGFNKSYPNLENQGIDLTGEPNSAKGWFILWTPAESPLGTNGAFYTLAQDPVTKTVKAAKVTPGSGTSCFRILRKDVTGEDGKQGAILYPGTRVVVSKTIYLNNDDGANFTPGRKVSFRSALFKGRENSSGVLGGHEIYATTNFGAIPRINIVTQWDAIDGFGFNDFTMDDPSVVPIENMSSLECDDPRAAIHPKDWVFKKGSATTPGNTFGRVNGISSLGKAPTLKYNGGIAFPNSATRIVPQQDTDSSGLITDASMYMPPPKGVGSNDKDHDNGRVTSIGELGYVHTGNEGTTHTSAKPIYGSVPWRTIRLQPTKINATWKFLPDWAFMDLFSVPNIGTIGPNILYTPHDTSVGGRVNVNSHVEPFQELQRDRGLVALLAGTKALPNLSEAENVAANIYRRNRATGANFGKVYGYPWKSAPAATESDAFDTPGEVCEIKGIADSGEKSEDLVREVVSLITARGNVFNIYTVGQALKQTPAGKLVITGEQRQQAVVERYLDDLGTLDTSSDDQVRFRTVYFRNLTP